MIILCLATVLMPEPSSGMPPDMVLALQLTEQVYMPGFPIADMLEHATREQWMVPFFWILENDTGDDAHIGVIRALGNWKVRSAAPYLIGELEKGNPRTWVDTAEALGKLRSRKAVNPLIKALRRVQGLPDKSVLLRVFIHALGQIKDPRATDLILSYLTDPEPAIRMVAVRALGEIRDERAVKPLIRMLRDRDDRVKDVAAVSLRQITGQPFGTTPEDWEEWLHDLKKKGGYFIFIFTAIIGIGAFVLAVILRKKH
ncbi:MAG: HEAT repeat domain-containing protein [Candidatus Omnitrophota bacterium]